VVEKWSERWRWRAFRDKVTQRETTRKGGKKEKEKEKGEERKGEERGREKTPLVSNWRGINFNCRRHR